METLIHHSKFYLMEYSPSLGLYHDIGYFLIIICPPPPTPVAFALRKGDIGLPFVHQSVLSP